jgi:hypothetical protein
VAFDITLGGQKIFAALADLIVNVRRPAWIRDRLDGPESVFACGTRQESSITLKVSIAFVAIVTACMEIRTIGIRLPDFHQGVTQGLTSGIENSPGDPCHFTSGWACRVVDDQRSLSVSSGSLFG